MFSYSQFKKYAGTVLFLSCLFGTMMNILIFGQRIYRHRTGSRYLLVASFCDLIHLTCGPLSNLLQYGFHYHSTINSNRFCQIKTYFIWVSTAISATLTTLATINQFLLSSKKHKRWKFSSRKNTLRSIYLSITFCFLISIPIPFCFTHTFHSSENEQLTCQNLLDNSFCFFIQIFHICLINGFLHPLLIIFFSLFKYLHSQLTRKSSFFLHFIHRTSKVVTNTCSMCQLTNNQKST